MTKLQLGLLVSYIDAAIEKERAQSRLMDGGDTSRYDRASERKTELFNMLAATCSEQLPAPEPRVGGSRSSEIFGASEG